MTILVEMSVRPPDPAAFRAACSWLDAATPPAGLRSSQVLADEGGSGLFCMLQEWADHATFHAYTERVGQEFNERAGTVGVAWDTRVWAPTDIRAHQIAATLPDGSGAGDENRTRTVSLGS